MDDTLKATLRILGIYKPLKHFHTRHIKSRGFSKWKPLIPEEKFVAAVKASVEKLLQDYPPQSFGNYLEFGVSRGTSMASVFHLMNNLGLEKIKLIGFDSFQGLPLESANEGWTPGAFHSTLKATQRYLNRRNIDWSRVKLIKGWFADTLNEKTKTELNLEKASVIMIDCDIYSASKQALKFSLPLIKDRAVIIFDDWGSEDGIRIGQKEAFEEVLHEFPYFNVTPLPSYIDESRIFFLTRNHP